MRIIVVGATGTIGSQVAAQLGEHHEIVPASRNAAISVDIEDPTSIAAMYRLVGPVDAVVCAGGAAAFGPLADLSDEDFALSLRSKLMGQVNLVRLGRDTVRDGGSFTLTSGILARRPAPGTSALALVNGALEAFVGAAALDLDRGLRINVVSPGWITETMEKLGMDSSTGTPAAEVARAYVGCVEGKGQGEVVLP